MPARVRGEQSEAKDQPQTRVNSIRPGIVTSQRSQHICGLPGVCGEVRGASLILSPDIPRRTGTEERCRVVGVRMVRRLHGLSQESCGLAERAAAVRALIVAVKRVTTVERRGVERQRRNRNPRLTPAELSADEARRSATVPDACRVCAPRLAPGTDGPHAGGSRKGVCHGARALWPGERRDVSANRPSLPTLVPQKAPACGHLLIGEPDAGNLHVRFGGRGGANQCAIPTSISRSAAMPLRLAVLAQARGELLGSKNNCLCSRFRACSQFREHPAFHEHPCAFLRS